MLNMAPGMFHPLFLYVMSLRLVAVSTKSTTVSYTKPAWLKKSEKYLIVAAKDIFYNFKITEYALNFNHLIH